MASISPSQIVSILPLFHRWLPNRVMLFGVTDDREPLVGGLDLLGDRAAGLVAVGCDLDRLALVGGDAIAELAAGLLAQSSCWYRLERRLE